MKRLFLAVLAMALFPVLADAQPASGQIGQPGPFYGPPTITPITFTTSSALAWANIPSRYWRLQNVSATAVMWCSWNGTPSVNGAGSFELAAGGSLTYETDFIPNAPLYCLGSAAGTATLETN